MNHMLQCQTCGHEFEPYFSFQGCRDCRNNGDVGRLEVKVEYDTIRAFRTKTGTHSMWKYADALPAFDHPISLGEGGTPLIPAPTLSSDLGIEVMLKNETVNPTWSYKDRLNSHLMTAITHFESTPRVAAASAGNHGASTAAYARRASIQDVVVILPNEVERPILSQITAYGAVPVIVETRPDDGTPADSNDRRDLLHALTDHGWLPTINMSSTDYVGIPYGYEGYKTISFEIVEQLDRVPDVVVVPVGDGDGLYGTWKGFRELHENGLVDNYPRMIGVQSTERQPLVKSLERGMLVDDPGPQPITTSTDLPSVGPHAVDAITQSGGEAFAIPRADVERALIDLGTEGVFVEPASALVLAGIRTAVAESVIGTNQLVVPVLTGSGIKWPNKTEDILGTVPRIEASLESLQAHTPFDVYRH